MWLWDASWETVWVGFPTLGSYIVFKIMNCSLWTCSKSLMPYSIQFINNYKFLLHPCWGLVFFYSSCLLHLCWVFLFVFPLMGKAEWGGNPVCWWLGFYFCFVCCLDEASCTECYWWLGDAGSCIQVVLFVWVLTIWYSWWAAVYGVAQSDTTEVT